jgi:hypothetical protein
MLDIEAVLKLSDEGLARVDPLEMNLMVARGIPSLSNLDIPEYQAQADACAAEVGDALPAKEKHFWQAPAKWNSDVHFFRLGVLCWYLDEVLGIAYREDQRELDSVLYTDPSDLFINGVMDERRGTCSNMAALYVALAWRLGWPVSLARAGYHQLARYEDGLAAYNIEVTSTGLGGFRSPPDAYYARYSYSKAGLFVGCDLRRLRPREVLGMFLGGRARYYRDTGLITQALRDSLAGSASLAGSVWVRPETCLVGRVGVGPTGNWNVRAALSIVLRTAREKECRAIESFVAPLVRTLEPAVIVVPATACARASTIVP